MARLEHDTVYDRLRYMYYDIAMDWYVVAIYIGTYRLISYRGTLFYLDAEHASYNLVSQSQTYAVSIQAA